MTTPFTDLTTPPTEQAVREHLIGLLRAAGLPTAAWEAGSLPRTMLTVLASALTDLAGFVATTAQGAFLRTATGDWLSRHGEEQFDCVREPGCPASGIVTLTDAGQVGPVMLDPAMCIFAMGTLRYNAVGAEGAPDRESFLIPLGGSVRVRIVAEAIGARYNVAANAAALRWLTPSAGVVVADAPSFIAKPGADPETDEDYRGRCLSRWATLGTGTNAEALAWTALSSHPTVRRHLVTNDPATGSVYVTLAAANGTVNGEALSAATTALLAKRPLCMDIRVQAAAERRIPVAGTVTIAGATSIAQLTGLIPEALAKLAGTYAIGETVHMSQVVAALQAVPGVYFVDLSGPGASTALDACEVPTFGCEQLVVSNGLTTQLVLASRSLPRGLP